MPRFCAQSSEASRTVAAPSVNGVELAAVMVPPGPVENRLQLGHFLQGNVLADVVVAEHAGAGDDEVVHEAFVIGGCRLFVALIGQQILCLAGDAPFLGHQLAMLAHAEAGARLGGRRRLRRQLGRE